MVVLKDESTTQRNGTMTMTVQMDRSACELASTATSPPVRVVALLGDDALVGRDGSHRRSLLSPPPVSRLVANTIAANSSVTTASTTPIAVA